MPEEKSDEMSKLESAMEELPDLRAQKVDEYFQQANNIIYIAN